MILIGHPTGNPNSHHAALSHAEAGRLAAFVVPYFPGKTSLRLLRWLPGMHSMAMRLERRRFEPLASFPIVQGRPGEFRRLALRALGLGDESLSYEANDWLMKKMSGLTANREVSAVHCYEDAALSCFESARRLGKPCIYDMPIGYYAAWESVLAGLLKKFEDWVPAGGVPSSRYVRPRQKALEMELADLVLAPSSFAEATIRAHFPGKTVRRAGYGVDSDFWHPPDDAKRSEHPMRFVYAGQLSIRKGIPLLLQAWERARVGNCELHLVGQWQLADSKRSRLPRGVSLQPPCSREDLRARFQECDVFVFPSNFEGFGLVFLEAMACGLPAIASGATGGPDVLDDSMGRTIEAGNLDSLVASLEWFASHPESLDDMRRAARLAAVRSNWASYRTCVREAVDQVLPA